MNSWQPRQTAPGRSSGSPLLAVNFLPVTYTAGKFPADMIPFESREQLRELRAELTGTHAVTRAGGRIACVPLSAEAPSVGRRAELDVREDRRITAHLVEEALVRDVLSRWYKFRKLSPPIFVNRSHDIFRETVQALGAELDGVHVYPQYSLTARATGPTGGPGIILGIKTRYEISLPVSELIRRGVHVPGRYILVEPDELDPRLDPVAARRLAGVIEAIAEGLLLLRDAPRSREVPADAAWLEGRRDVVHDVVHALAGTAAEGILNRLDKAAFGVTSAEKNPAIAVVAPAAFKGTAEMFIRSFLDGVPRSSFAKGFTRRYHLGSCEVAFEAFGSSPDDVAAYRNACLSALQKPLLLKLHRESTFTDMEYLAGQAFRFTAMSWRPRPRRPSRPGCGTARCPARASPVRVDAGRDVGGLVLHDLVIAGLDHDRAEEHDRADRGRDCQAFTSSRTASVTRETCSTDSSVP